MLYFIKDNTIHQFPVPARCGARYVQEILRDTVPHSVTECPYCLRFWPETKS